MATVLPRVTEILRACGLGPDLSRVPVADLERARNRGSAIHQAIEDYHYNLLEPARITPDLEPYFAAHLHFLAETKHEPLVSEVRVEHAQWRYCGHIDRVGWLHGKRGIFDWKCADTLDLIPVGYQLAAYRLAWNASRPTEPVAFTAAVQLRSDGSYRLHAIDAARVEHVFLAAVTVYHAQQQRAA